jgi:F-type H+-transporting ATPase subunit epsilon
MSHSRNHNHNHLQFELVSPEKLILSRPVAMVTVPGGEGEYGVLVGHAPMITTVKPGVIDVYADENSEPSERIFVSGGFAEVTPQHCVVLADEAMPVAQLDRAALEEEARELSDKIASAPEESRTPLLAQQEIIAAKVKAAA